MTAEIYVACDGDWDAPEVQISGSSKALADFGLLLNEARESISYTISDFDAGFYSVKIKTVNIELAQLENDRLTVKIDKSSFKLAGTRFAFNKLGDSLINFFDEQRNIGEHFQLDYYLETKF